MCFTTKCAKDLATLTIFSIGTTGSRVEFEKMSDVLVSKGTHLPATVKMVERKGKMYTKV